MTFAHPWMLVLLVVPAALAVILWKRGGRRIPLPFDHQPFRRVRWMGFLLKSADMLPAILLSLVVVILAGPRRFEQPRSEREMTNILFCLDVSGSMTATFGSGTRYDAAMEAVNDFISFRKGDAFGLTVFGSAVLNWVPLTTDVSAFRCAPPFLNPSTLPPWFGGTSIGMALRSAEKTLLAGESGDRMIVLFTDGMSYDLMNGQDLVIAQSLKENGIKLYGIHVAEGGAPDEVGVIASVTGGEVFSAGDPAALKAIFAHIDEMEKAPLKRVVPDPVDFFQPFALAGLGIGTLYLGTLFGWRHTPW
ncbi:Ca-activated chloride channel family protein [Haloferula luteola]|uniref:Ca-activated chloride channel family protein n=1 Tax=Haloferula luteola TaxID=595692 RepID=A0A840VFW2_9BACT|nr:VWA domain-containing protein [Haloferula luteola]MBB5352710.1 Ca-activated chloride channel family protein [Haloferula luteola]